MTDSAKKLDTQSKLRSKLLEEKFPKYTSKGLSLLSHWIDLHQGSVLDPKSELRIVPLTHDSTNIFMPIEQAQKLVDRFHENFPRLTSHDSFSPKPRYVIIFRKKS